MGNRAPDLAALLREAGVVGAGGAGFPSHIKAAAKADMVIVNAAECEPLLHKDIEILEHFTAEVLDGIELMMAATGAREGVVGIKRKHAATVKMLETAAKGRAGIRVHPLGDFYPAGDEYCLVYEVTGKTIPPGGIPMNVGAVVNNVETFLNISRARTAPVTHTFVTVCGAVRKPATYLLPVGMTFAEAIALSGGPTVQDPAAIDGGPMMGKVTTDFTQPLTKTSSGIIVLPKTHPLIIAKAAGRPAYSKIGRSACDQCSMCTMLCPRNLLGYAVEPHRVMRNLLFTGRNGTLHSESALLCCECSLCSLYSCPEGLDPRNTCVSAKADLRAANITLKNSSIAKRPSFGPHPMRDFRKVPVNRLVAKLGLLPYKKEAPLTETSYSPARVRIMLSQHLGAPCAPVVSVGQKVAFGAKVGEAPAGQLGAPVHASIAGTVSAVTNRYVEIEA